MKRTAIAVALLCVTASALTPVYAADPCDTVACLYGKATGGDGGSACNAPEKAFFDILKWKKGSISWSRTADARKALLNQCSGAAVTAMTGGDSLESAVSLIISKFGRVKNA